jgi:hypothetical protein
MAQTGSTESGQFHGPTDFTLTQVTVLLNGRLGGILSASRHATQNKNTNGPPWKETKIVNPYIRSSVNVIQMPVEQLGLQKEIMKQN